MRKLTGVSHRYLVQPTSYRSLTWFAYARGMPQASSLSMTVTARQGRIDALIMARELGSAVAVAGMEVLKKLSAAYERGNGPTLAGVVTLRTMSATRVPIPL